MTLEVRVVEGGFAKKKLIEAQVGAPTVFRHGAPNSPLLWRKVMPACVGLGRLTACDLIGMDDNDKLQGLRPDCPPAAQLIGRACG